MMDVIPEGTVVGMPLAVDGIYELSGLKYGFPTAGVGLAAEYLIAVSGAWLTVVPIWIIYRVVRLRLSPKTSPKSMRHDPFNALLSIMMRTNLIIAVCYFLVLALHGWLGNHCEPFTLKCAGPSQDIAADIGRALIVGPVVVCDVLWVGSLAIYMTLALELEPFRSPEQPGATAVFGLLTLIPYSLFLFALGYRSFIRKRP